MIPTITESGSLEGIRNNPGTLLACGADVKNRFCFYHRNRLYLSQDHGNLAEPERFTAFRDSIQEAIKACHFDLACIAVDKHPAYFSSQIPALFPGVPVIPVQHHHAHIAAFQAARTISEPIIGISFDGTGYGDDGELWGGEFLIVDHSRSIRAASLDYMRIAGGEKAIREPWRIAFCLGYQAFGKDIMDMALPMRDLRSAQEYRIIQQALLKNINVFQTSSCGRLFDGVSALLGINLISRFEAEAAVLLEQAAEKSDDKTGYAFTCSYNSGRYNIDYRPVIQSVITDKRNGISVERIARRFHNSIITLILDMVQRLSKEHGTSTVVLSGGVFQNKILYSGSVCILKEAGYNVVEIPALPMNDLNICIGQVYVAAQSIGKA